MKRNRFEIGLCVLIWSSVHASTLQAAETSSLTIKLEDGVGQLLWTSDGKYLISRSGRWEKDPNNDARGIVYNKIQVWDAKTGKEKSTFGETKNSGQVSVEISPDGKMLAISYRLSIALGDKVELWEIENTNLVKTIEFDYGRIPPFVFFSPKGDLVAVVHTTANEEGLIGGALLFDSKTGEKKHGFFGHQHLSSNLAFSPDGKTIVTTGSDDGKILFWDLATEKQVRSFSIESGIRIHSAAFSKDGKKLVTSANDGRVLVWDLAKGKEEPLANTSHMTQRIAFSPNGDWLVASGYQEKDGKQIGELRLWKTSTDELLRTWDNSVSGYFAFSPDNKKIAIGHADKTIRVWQIGEMKK